MATLLGTTLDGELFERLAGHGPARHRTLVLPLCTVDPDGWPHVALLSPTEIVAIDPATLRAALYADSRTTAYLRQTGRATLLVFDAGLACYLKLRAEELPQRIAATPWNAVFELRVEQVLADAAGAEREGRATIAGGVTFDPDPAHEQTRAAVLAALRAGG